MCHYSRSTKGHAELVASTCRTAVDGVATAFIAAEEPDPRLDSDGKTSFLLLQQFKGYKNNDPGKQSQQCLPFSLLKKMFERSVTLLAIFIVFRRLKLLGFFFAMRSCENFKVSGERRTHPIRKRNMVFRKDGRILPLSSPRLHLSDTIAITFKYQKRDKRNDTVTQWRTGNSTYCPVVVSSAVVRRLEAMGASESDFIYKFKGNDGRTRDFDSTTALRMLRGFISSVNFKGLGLDPKRIGLHSSLVSGHGNVSQRCTGVHHHVAQSLVQRRFSPLHPEASRVFRQRCVVKDDRDKSLPACVPLDRPRGPPHESQPGFIYREYGNGLWR